MSARARMGFLAGLSIAAVGVGYAIWGVVLMDQGGEDANIGAGIAILLGGVLLLAGVAVILLVRHKSRTAHRNQP